MDHRARIRFSLDREIQCHINDVADWVFLYDLSVGGAMIEVTNIKIEVGDPVSLNLFDFTTALGQIVWKSDKNAGVRFNMPLSDTIVEYLGFHCTTLSFDERSPKDRFGELIGASPQDTGHPCEGAHADADPKSADWLATAHPQRDRRDRDRGESNRRRETRLAVDAKASLRSVARNSVEGRLVDLSARGCSFVDRWGTFEPGHEVWLKIASLEPWKGTVRWVSPDRVGIEFDRALHLAIFEHLAKSNPTAVCSKAA